MFVVSPHFLRLHRIACQGAQRPSRSLLLTMSTAIQSWAPGLKAWTVRDQGNSSSGIFENRHGVGVSAGGW
jgi:hypothetical protein